MVNRSSILVQNQLEVDDEDLSGLLHHLKTMPSPRVIKSHLPLYLLPPGLTNTSKVIERLISC